MHSSGAARREIAKSYVELEHRHCERSEAIHLSFRGKMDCFAALAMTAYNELSLLFEKSFRKSECANRPTLAPPTPSPSLRAQRSNPYFLRGEMDCFAEPVIGRATTRLRHARTGDDDLNWTMVHDPRCACRPIVARRCYSPCSTRAVDSRRPLAGRGLFRARDSVGGVKPSSRCHGIPVVLAHGNVTMSEECPERRFRTLFISDVHLGARGSQAERLLDFLRSHDADTIYLVGDIVDGWALQSNWYWPQSHNDFVQKMLRKARKGAKVIYVPGNHDEFLRGYYLAHFGDKAYDFAIRMNRIVNVFRRWFGVPYWSLSQWAKLKVKNAVNYIGAFEQTLAAEARRHGADGVICGHIHYATIRDEHGIRYMNCGDWVESCTALAEHEDGRFEIITWTDPLRRVAPVTSVAARAA